MSHTFPATTADLSGLTHRNLDSPIYSVSTRFHRRANVSTRQAGCSTVSLRKSGRVEGWRGSLRPCQSPRFHTPAHQTGRADFPHPAFGPRLMLTPTEGCAWSTPSGVIRVHHKGARRGTSASPPLSPCIFCAATDEAGTGHGCPLHGRLC